MRPGEDDLIATYFAPLAGAAALGLRDDAACLPPTGQHLVVTKDMLVAGVHFFADDPPDAIARKALRVNLSDLAAKGATPCGFLLGLALPADWTAAWLAAFAGGLGDDARAHACPLLGGDTVATGGPLTLSITALGHVAPGAFVPRPGAVVGDVLFVSGTIGDAALGLGVRRKAVWAEALSEDDRAFLRGRYLLPEPRLALAPVLRAHARSAMDVSDGLAGDLGKMLALDGLTAEIPAAAVPLSPAAGRVLANDPDRFATVLGGGDDYEILCAVASASAAAFAAAAAEAGVRVTRLGTAVAGTGPPCFRLPSGAPVEMSRASHQHFV